MKIFTATPKMKIGAFVLFLLMLFCTGATVYAAIEFNSALTDVGEVFGNVFAKNSRLSPIGVISWTLCSLPVLFFGLLSVWTWVYFNAVRKTRLIFDDRSITFEFNPRLPSYRNRGFKPFSIQYEQIQRINGFGETGAFLEIVDLQGKVYRLAPIMFGKSYGENVLEELRSRLPSDIYGSIRDYSEVQKTWLKKHRMASIPLLICFLAFFITIFFDPMMSSRTWIRAWQIEFNPPWNESVWGYAPDAQNGFWIVGWHPSYYRIYHFPNQNGQEWKLPKSILGDEYPNVASQDQTGNPIVWSTKSVFHYTNGNWETIPFQNNLTYIDWLEDGGVRGEYAWGVENEQFFKIEALTGAWSVISLPNSATELNLAPASMRRNIRGDVLILMEDESASRVYNYKDEQWATQEYSVILPKVCMVWDYFLDNQNQLWVLFSTDENFFVERIDTSGELKLTELPTIQDTEHWRPYRKIFIDSHERMWVTAGSYPPVITVFQATWNGYATQIVRYTRGNSNYKEGSSNESIMLPDGKIWGFDYIITSMDTNQEELPAPLPDWFGNLDWNMIRLFVIPFQFIAIIYQVVQTRKWAKQSKQGK